MSKLQTIVLVNEGPGDRQVLCRQLDIFPDFLLETTDSVEGAVDLAKRGGADLILIKLQISDVNRLKRLENLVRAIPNVPVTVYTEHYDDQFAVDSLRTGAQDYFIRNQIESVWFVDRLRFAIERHRIINKVRLEQKRDHHMATHDSLTGLPNRQLFADRFEQAVAQADRSGQQALVMFIDLNRFKEINDTLGHKTGDQLLQAVAKRLLACIRKSDTAARLGGDEFTIIINNVADSASKHAIVEKIRIALSRPYIVAGRRLPITPSVGVAAYPTEGQDLETLLERADAKMYEEKRQGRKSDVGVFQQTA